MFIEVKKPFKLFELLVQIKQNAKIINSLSLNNYNDIKLPKYIIGIICSYTPDKIKDRLMELKQPYKNEKKLLFHILWK